MSEKIARSIGKNSEEIEIIQYGLHQAFFMLINFITIIICGLLWQELIFSLVLFTAIYFIRPYAGGYHADTEIRCYFLSVVLADEPTGNLDYRNKNEIIEIFKEIKKNGKTIICVTHNKDVADSADRVINLSSL